MEKRLSLKTRTIKSLELFLLANKKLGSQLRPMIWSSFTVTYLTPTDGTMNRML